MKAITDLKRGNVDRRSVYGSAMKEKNHIIRTRQWFITLSFFEGQILRYDDSWACLSLSGSATSQCPNFSEKYRLFALPLTWLYTRLCKKVRKKHGWLPVSLPAFYFTVENRGDLNACRSAAFFPKAIILWNKSPSHIPPYWCNV